MADLNNETKYYPTPAGIAADVSGWIRKDAATGSTTYFGYAFTLAANTASAIWKIRREVITGTQTVVTYADGDFEYDNVWNNRASLTYR